MHRETVSYPANGDRASGHLAVPDAKGPHPGVVVIQEYWGLEPHIKDVAGRFTEHGFIALAPDLYHGKIAREPDEAMKLAMELDLPRAIKDITGAARYLIGRSDVQPKKLGVIGFCMGGRLALAFGAQTDLAGAIAAFYPGGYRPTVDEAKQVKAPILVHFGEEDHSLPEEARAHIERTFRAAGRPLETHIYMGAPHAFFNDTKPSHRPDSARQAWDRTIAWFSQHLKGAPVG
ncbi:MAG TPA: dienelactone hydrolase family protein [Candidatus Limnocylindrales bacterium]|nr:dienelactone hydrolase family protein [Candidatus Limnocylindrales bacterium]